MTLSGITHMFSKHDAEALTVKTACSEKTQCVKGSITIVCNMVKCGGKPHEFSAMFPRAVKKTHSLKVYIIIICKVVKCGFQCAVKNRMR